MDVEIIKIFYDNNKIKHLAIPTNGTFSVKETVEKILEQCPGLKLRVFVSIDDIKEKVDMLELGIEDYITKPFNFIEILARIRSILRSKFLKDEILHKEKRLESIRRFEKQVGSFLDEVKAYSKDLIESSKKKGNLRDWMTKIGGSLEKTVKGFELEYKEFIFRNREMEDKGYSISSLDDNHHN